MNMQMSVCLLDAYLLVQCLFGFKRFAGLCTYMMVSMKWTSFRVHSLLNFMVYWIS